MCENVRLEHRCFCSIGRIWFGDFVSDSESTRKVLGPGI